MQTLYKLFTAWGTRLRKAFLRDPYKNAQLRIALLYFLFCLLCLVAVSSVVDYETNQLFVQMHAHPELVSPDEVFARMEQVRLWGRLVYVALFAVGAYVLIGLAFEPVKRMAQTQQRFIANASHELRAPLASAHAELEVALRATDKLTLPEAIDLLRSSLHDIERVSRIIQFLLVLSDYQEHKATKEFESVDLASLSRTAVSHFSERAAQKNIELRTQLSSVRIRGYPIAIEKALINLLRNALAHTAAGTIDVALTADETHAIISVIDTGAGILHKDQEHLFDPFYRAENASSSGTGLGLAIVKEVMRMHNGSAELASELGKGTRVTLRFPRSS